MAMTALLCGSLSENADASYYKDSSYLPQVWCMMADTITAVVAR